MIGDNEIMAATVVTDKGVQYTLPDGQVMHGPKPENPAGIQSWCDGVRRNLEIVRAQAQNRRGSDSRSPRPKGDPVLPEARGHHDEEVQERPAPSAGEGHDPEKYAGEQLAYWEARRLKALDHLAVAEETLAEATNRVAKWKKVKEALS